MSPNHYSASITNLVRLGFIEISFVQLVKGTDVYSIYESSPFLALERQKLAENPKNIDRKIEIERGSITLTPLGKDFVSICI